MQQTWYIYHVRNSERFFGLNYPFYSPSADVFRKLLYTQVTSWFLFLRFVFLASFSPPTAKMCPCPWQTEEKNSQRIKDATWMASSSLLVYLMGWTLFPGYLHLSGWGKRYDCTCSVYELQKKLCWMSTRAFLIVYICNLWRQSLLVQWLTSSASKYGWIPVRNPHFRK
jgi:hypothetical protein